MDHSAAFVAENHLFGKLVRGADPSTPVATCPGWTIRKLAAHVARGDRWAATIVRERSSDPVDPRTVADGAQPDDRDAEQKWVEGGARALVDAVAATGAGTPVWTFTGPKPAGWWIRRRLHEATVHRADAALAIGVPYEIAPALAADGVSEWFDLLVARPDSSDPVLSPGASLHLHATDEGLGTEGEWILRGTDTGLAWEHGHEKATVAVRGTAADLLLAVLRRGGDVEVLGDPTIWSTWLERTGF